MFKPAFLFYSHKTNNYPVFIINFNQMITKAFPLLFSMVLFSVSLTTTCFAQKVKYGKVEMSELEMTQYDKDPEAVALVLYESQDIQFQYNNDKGFQVQTDRHIRIKVFKKSGFDYVDLPISLYQADGNFEKLTAFKAMTFNLVDGNIEKEKIGQRETFQEEVDKYTVVVKFAMPNLQEGSIVDINYTVLSDFLFELTPWRYQYEIPVVKSEFFAEIPEYFIYKTTNQGYEQKSITENETSFGQGKFSFRTSTTPNQVNGAMTEMSSIEFKTKSYKFEAKEVPAFHSEPYMAAPSNFISKIEFELSGTDFPSSYRQEFNRTWENVRHLLMTDSDFGGRLDRKRPVLSTTEELTKDLQTNEEKISAIFQYVQKQYKWNGNFSHFPRTSINDLLNTREGFSSDLNFLLLQMLRAANIEAYPVSLSTRNHGFINPVSPRITQFNHVIAAAKIGENFILMDATDEYTPIGMLPDYDLNLRGRLFTDTYTDWVSLIPSKKYKKATQAKLLLNEDGTFEGSINMLFSEYAALDFRERMQKQTGGDKATFLNSRTKEDEEGLEVLSSTFENVDNIQEKITASYEVKIVDKAIQNGDLIYFEPLLFFGEKENPFTAEDRKFPVDLLLPLDLTYILQLTIPDGYVIEELPENIAFSLPESGGSFLYEFKKVNDRLVQLTNRMSIKETFFLPNNYLPLREYFNLIIEKQGAQVVLKKTD